MKIALRILVPLLAIAACGLAAAHPGHGAPAVHAHDLDELLALAALGLWAAMLGCALFVLIRGHAVRVRRPR